MKRYQIATSLLTASLLFGAFAQHQSGGAASGGAGGTASGGAALPAYDEAEFIGSLPAREGVDGAGMRVLLFSKTAGFRHDSIPASQEVMRRLSITHNFDLTQTEDASIFNERALREFDVVVFASTTGEVLDAPQQEAFEAFVEAGGGFVGVHAASDTLYEWPWYGELVGAYFEGHPPGTSVATVQNEDVQHASTDHLGASFQLEDEWYFFDRNPREDVHVLLTLDKGSNDALANYGEGAEAAEESDHPITWCQEYEGGRSWYTALGHRSEVWQDVRFQEMLLDGVLWAAERAAGSCTLDMNVNREVLVSGMQEPMTLDVASDGRVFYNERAGSVNVWSEEGGLQTIRTFDVATEEEHGMLGLALDPDFDENNYIYLYYTPKEGEGNHLVRYTYDDSDGTPKFVEGSAQELLTVPTVRDTCCHVAGAINFGPDGKLYLSTGDNTNPFESDGFAPIDRQPGRDNFNALRTAGNPNDLRGKILRLNKDGSVPDDNPFVGQEGHRPEVYAMGFRNPFRFRIDPETGWLLVGNVGPDANDAIPNRGPSGYDEWHVITEGGQDAGWPTCIGNNRGYENWDFAAQRSRGTFDCSAKAPATIWYPYSHSDAFPELGQVGRNAQGGPRLHNIEGAAYQWPDEVVGKWLIYEWQRHFIQLATFSEDGTQVEGIEPFMTHGLIRPMDLIQGPDGALYLLEYGTNWFAANADARLSRITPGEN